MGAYLSEPVTEKHSIDEANEFLQVGASSMQGWRISQEDAHNCILKLDENTSYFAVYDGHGGAEVAKYCSEKLPDFVKNLESFKNGKFDQALKEAFLKFDATLLEEDVIEELKKIAGERNADESNSDDIVDDEEEEEDLAELYQEGKLSLDQVLAKYKVKKEFEFLSKLKAETSKVDKSKEDEVEAGSSGSKPLFPRLRGRRNLDKSSENQPASSSASSSAAGTSTSTHLIESNDDSQVSSSETKCILEKEEIDKQNEIKSSEAVSASDQTCKTNGEKDIKKPTTAESSSSSGSASSSTVKNSSSPDSSISNSLKTDKVQNGDIKAETSSGVSSSSTSKNENGPKSFYELTSKGLIDLYSNKNDGNDDDDEEEEDSEDDWEEDSVSSDDLEKECREIEIENSNRYYAESEDETEEWIKKNEEQEIYNKIQSEKFCADMIEEPGKDSGCTAVVAILNGRDLYVANAGDSRCVVCRGGKAIDMSIDHKPEDIEELQRIKKAGGHVTLDGRVNGGLNLSRAIGDHAYKMNSNLSPQEQMISALPDVKKLILEPNDEFMILACDGIWNYMSSEEVVELVKEFIDENFEDMSAICEELLSTCLAPSTLGDGTGCDNMTAIIIRFKPTVFELPTKLNPDETIINKEKKVSVKDTAEKSSESTSNKSAESKPKAKKRSVSPAPSENSALTSTTASVDEPEEQSMKRFKSNDVPSSSTSTSEAVAVETEKKNNTDIAEIAEENVNQSQMDADTAEADAAAASITTTTET